MVANILFFIFHFPSFVLYCLGIHRLDKSKTSESRAVFRFLRNFFVFDLQPLHVKHNTFSNPHEFLIRHAPEEKAKGPDGRDFVGAFSGFQKPFGVFRFQFADADAKQESREVVFAFGGKSG
jgi:hypothetical protein